MRKKIAVFICAISFGNQKRVLDGILESAKNNDIDVFIFTCHVNYDNSLIRDDGAFSVMLLPDIERFDGVIIMKNSIRKQDVANALVERIIKSGKPAVSVEENIAGMHYAGISNYQAQKQMVEHLITKHHVKSIGYVSGVIENEEGRQRLDAFRDAVNEANIPSEKYDIYHGDYIAASGKRAVKYFLQQHGRLPEAIVCANDGMAMGVMEELDANGYRVPRDVLVTGFDNDILSHYSIPSLTTADQQQEIIGKKAVLILLENPPKLINENVEPSSFIGESCGCLKHNTDLDNLRKIYTKQTVQMQQAMDEIKNMSIDLAGLGSLDEMYEKLKRYILTSDVKRFFLCLKDECEWLNENQILDKDSGLETDNTPQVIHIPLTYCDGEFSKCQDIGYGEILPQNVLNTPQSDFYIVSPLYYGKTNFGYCVQQGSKFAFESELAYSWIVNVGVAIENIRKFKLMQMMVERLNSMWMYDTLTEIYNRGGFYHLADKLLTKWKKADSLCYILFLDLDGLKQINDNLGHECGDACIKSMAKILNKTLKMSQENTGDSLCMRYGGDEFVAFGECQSLAQVERIICLLRENMDLENNLNNDFSVACSIGFSIYRAKEMEGLSHLIDDADKKMYQEKKAKRMR